MALLAPIPRASDRIATPVNNGLRRRPRMAYRRSDQVVLIGGLTVPESDQLSSKSLSRRRSQFVQQPVERRSVQPPATNHDSGNLPAVRHVVQRIAIEQQEIRGSPGGDQPTLGAAAKKLGGVDRGRAERL